MPPPAASTEIGLTVSRIGSWQANIDAIDDLAAPIG